MEVFLKTQTPVPPHLFTGPALKTQFLMGNELRRGEEKRRRAPESLPRGKIDAHSGGCGEPLGDERLYQQGD